MSEKVIAVERKIVFFFKYIMARTSYIQWNEDDATDVYFIYLMLCDLRSYIKN
jgi:hypothetical protein